MDNYDIYFVSANLKLLFNNMQSQLKTNINGKIYNFLLFNDTFLGVIYNNETYGLEIGGLVYSFDNSLIFGLDKIYGFYVGVKKTS